MTSREEEFNNMIKVIQGELKDYMYTTSLSLDQIADEIGIARSTLYYVMRNGQGNVRRQTLVKIRKFLWDKHEVN